MILPILTLSFSTVSEASAANVDDLSPGKQGSYLPCIHNMLCLMRIKKSRWPEIGHWQLVSVSHILTLKVVVT